MLIINIKALGLLELGFVFISSAWLWGEQGRCCFASLREAGLAIGKDHHPEFCIGTCHLESRNGLGWERTSEGHPVQPTAMGRDIFSWVRLLRAPSILTLNVPRDGASPTSLSNLGQGFSTLVTKNFSLVSSPNLPSCSFKPLPVVL